MKYIFIVCLCSVVFCISVLFIALAIDILDGTDLMNAIAERIRSKK